MKTFILFTALLTSLGSISIAEEIKAVAPVKIEEAEKQLATGAQLLDVRTKEEWTEGHLKGAKLVTVTEDGFLEKAKALLDPKKPVVVYCRSGKRSAMATEQLRANGFTVFDLEGGITAWKAAGKAVEK
ncbi:MAG: rhodanese-like domain-containing protein [Akkermansiaceae bacterium]|nr:rhodanese-like domain-containing protein [Luteolibacter sp.]